MMGRVLVILILLSSTTFSQTDGKSKYILWDEFGAEPAGVTRNRLDTFLVELMDNPKLKGYMISYKNVNAPIETYSKPSKKTHLFNHHLRLRKFDKKRIAIIDGGFRFSELNKLILASSDAEPPSSLGFEHIPKASKIEAFGRENNGVTKARMDYVAVSLQNSDDGKIYIINNGDDAEVLKRERFMKTYIFFRRFDASKYKFLRGKSYGELKTVVWLVPRDAKVSIPPYNVVNFRSLNWRVWTRNFNRALNEQKANKCQEKIYVVVYGKSDKSIKSIIKTYSDYVAKKSLCKEMENNGIELVEGGISRNYSTAIWLLQNKN